MDGFGPDLGGGFASRGYNLIGIGDGATWFSPGAVTDQAGTVTTPLDPVLGALQMNGGTTPTHELLSGSPAIDQGNCFGLDTDQRGRKRSFNYGKVSNASFGDGSDIGAFERHHSDR